MNESPTLIRAGRRDLGDGFSVRRLLPHPQTRHVGPFVFFDHMGPVHFEAGQGLDVRPHPHIGLATVTWLFEGSIRHRDSLGSLQDIVPGEVNWMTAGTGIVHSERTPPSERAAGGPLHGIQTWVALPRDLEDIPPAFDHVKGGDIPVLEGEGWAARLIAGSAYGLKSPVPVHSPMFYLEVRMQPEAELEWPVEHRERGVYVVDGEVGWGGLSIQAGQMGVQAASSAPRLRARAPSLLILFGGAPLDGERVLWWNFVASSRERIDRAAERWQAGDFPVVPGDEDERIPLPER